jgi:hypothetical protein
MDIGLAPPFFSFLVVSTAVVASSMQRQASSNWPSSALARAKYGRKKGRVTLDPIDRHVAILDLNAWTAFDALPVRAIAQP